MEGCGLGQISLYSFTGLTNLRELHLPHNGLNAINNGNSRRRKVISTLFLLDISHNDLSTFPDFSNVLPNIKELNITHNNLANFSEILKRSGGYNLTNLYLKNNPCVGKCDSSDLCDNVTYTIDICVTRHRRSIIDNKSGQIHSILYVVASCLVVCSIVVISAYVYLHRTKRSDQQRNNRNLVELSTIDKESEEPLNNFPDIRDSSAQYATTGRRSSS